MRNKNKIKILLAIITLLMPKIVFATKYIVCDEDKKIPYIFASMVSTFFTIIKIAVPILLVISGMISFFKVTASSNVDDEMKKAKSKLINSIIAAVIIFFVFSIVNFAVSLVAGTNNKFMKCAQCFINTDKCETTDETKNLCPGFIDGEYDKDCNPINQQTKAPTQSNNITQNNMPSDIENISFDGFLFIGDSRYNGIKTQLKNLGSNIYVSAVNGKSAVDWLNNVSGEYYLPKEASNVSVMLGVNNQNIKNMKDLLNNLHSKYTNATIYINSVYHVGAAYKAGYVNNNDIDNFNNTMKEYASQNSWLKYIDITSGLYESNGELKSEYTTDGLHMNSAGNEILINNIKKEINR